MGTSLTAAMALSCTKKETKETDAKKSDPKTKLRPPVDGGMPRPRRVIKSDRDQDGVPDATDRCPDVKGAANNHGCPLPKPPVVLGGKPVAPTPPTPSAPAPGGGAMGSDSKDSDGDGVPDAQDRCPRRRGPKSNHGCPVHKRGKIKRVAHPAHSTSAKTH